MSVDEMLQLRKLASKPVLGNPQFAIDGDGWHCLLYGVVCHAGRVFGRQEDYDGDGCGNSSWLEVWRSSGIVAALVSDKERQDEHSGISGAGYHNAGSAQPHATHVAVQNGRVCALGDSALADTLGADVCHDDSLRDTVLMPGFVEGHAHLLAGVVWRYVYLGYHDRVDPEGRFWAGLRILSRFAAFARGGCASCARASADSLGV